MCFSPIRVLIPFGALAQPALCAHDQNCRLQAHVFFLFVGPEDLKFLMSFFADLAALKVRFPVGGWSGLESRRDSRESSILFSAHQCIPCFFSCFVLPLLSAGLPVESKGGWTCGSLWMPAPPSNCGLRGSLQDGGRWTIDLAFVANPHFWLVCLRSAAFFVVLRAARPKANFVIGYRTSLFFSWSPADVSHQLWLVAMTREKLTSELSGMHYRVGIWR
jgi:hypothetical protein